MSVEFTFTPTLFMLGLALLDDILVLQFPLVAVIFDWGGR